MILHQTKRWWTQLAREQMDDLAQNKKMVKISIFLVHYIIENMICKYFNTNCSSKKEELHLGGHLGIETFFPRSLYVKKRGTKCLLPTTDISLKNELISHSYRQPWNLFPLLFYILWMIRIKADLLQTPLYVTASIITRDVFFPMAIPYTKALCCKSSFLLLFYFLPVMPWHLERWISWRAGWTEDIGSSSNLSPSCCWNKVTVLQRDESAIIIGNPIPLISHFSLCIPSLIPPISPQISPPSPVKGTFLPLVFCCPLSCMFQNLLWTCYLVIISPNPWIVVSLSSPLLVCF